MKGKLIRTIVLREWRTRVVKRSFLLGTLLTPLLSVGLIAASVLLTQGVDVHNVVLVEDAPGLITRQDAATGQYVPRCPGCFPERENLEYRFVREAPEDSVWKATGHTVLVEYDESVMQNKAGYLVYAKSPGVKAKRNIERDLSRALEHARVLGSTELDWEAYQRLKLDLTLYERESTATGREEGGGDEIRGGIGFMFSAILFVVLAVYGGMIMRSVVEEKSNHVVEVLVATIRPEELLLGKVIGVGAVALTQLMAWAILSTGSFALFQWVFDAGLIGDAGAVSAANEVPADLMTVMAQNKGLAVLLDIQWGVMVAGTVAFFIGGFLLYGSLYAAVGATVQSEQEGQGMVMAIIMPLMFAYIVGSSALGNPTLPIMVWLGWIPLTSPVMMLVRLATGVTWWEALLSWGLLMLTARFILGIAGRMYRLGVLHDGGRSGWKLWVHWIKGDDR
jgi:ABC-2 type transport system permease protein